MAFTHILLTQWNGNGEVITNNVSLTADAQEYRDLDVASGTVPSPTVVTTDLDLVNANVKLLVISSTRNIKVTPVDTDDEDGAEFSVVANVPLIWNSTTGATNPIGGTEISKLKVTNTSGAAATVKIRVLYDSTP